jgi:ATP-dependent Clp protease ATP-binding subunit ClpA
VFERFTERARQVVVLAQEEARALKHNYIGTEHLLLGLLREEEGVAARVLRSLGLTAEEVRAALKRIVGVGDEAAEGQVPFTPRAKKVLELALRDALALGDDYIRPEHLLFGLVRENEGVASQILDERGATRDRVRDELFRVLERPEPPNFRSKRPSRWPRRRKPKVPFGRFTGRARQVVVLAQDEARALKHNYIGTEHILLGLLREEEGLAARVLESLDITVEEVRAQVARIVGQGDEVTTGQIPFTPRAKKVLELALREALSLGHNYIGTEHILLGLVRENEGVAARILLDFDADAEKIRNEIIRMLSGTVARRPAEVPPEPPAPEPTELEWRPARWDAASRWVMVPALWLVAVGIGLLIGWAIWG